ncbi:hypothetical protein [Mesorhizobium silamurunense]|uniref:hypothetical protein n=1 Tax=Mesorhizobium silamurunense TaxID=499528 RepID=UPI001FED3F11|nr:hypothetical protein [Mesorhizobium silamurunense]
MRQVSPRFAFNYMAAPRLDVRTFFALARDQGLFSNPIASGMPAAEVRSAATEVGVSIISVNALQRFNAWPPARRPARRLRRGLRGEDAGPGQRRLGRQCYLPRAFTRPTTSQAQMPRALISRREIEDDMEDDMLVDGI